jgi:hypothetical protein
VSVDVASLEWRAVLKCIKTAKKPFEMGKVPLFRNDKINQNYFHKVTIKTHSLDKIIVTVQCRKSVFAFAIQKGED